MMNVKYDRISTIVTAETPPSSGQHRGLGTSRGNCWSVGTRQAAMLWIPIGAFAACSLIDLSAAAATQPQREMLTSERTLELSPTVAPVANSAHAPAEKGLHRPGKILPCQLSTILQLSGPLTCSRADAIQSQSHQVASVANEATPLVPSPHTSTLSPVTKPAEGFFPALGLGSVEVAGVETDSIGPVPDLPITSVTVGTVVIPELPLLESPDYYLPQSSPRFDGYIWPTRGTVSSGYGMRWGRMHRGIDIAAPVGTPIFASSSGEVIKVGWIGGYGKTVKLLHYDGSITLYGHASQFFVRQGEMVRQGQQIAAVGNTGRSTGPHLHFEIRPKGKDAVDPMAFLPKQGAIASDRGNQAEGATSWGGS